MFGKNPRDELLTFRRQVDLDEPPVVFLSLSSYPTMLLEIVDYESHIAAASQQLSRQHVLAHWPEVQQRLKHAKLAHGEPALLNLLAHACRHRIRGPDKVNVGVKRPNRLFRAFEVGQHIVQLE